MATQSVSMDKSSHRMRGSFSLAMMSKVDTIFMKYDADGNGALDTEQAIKALSELVDDEVTYEQIIAVLNEFDKDGNGVIDMSEFAVMAAFIEEMEDEEADFASKLISAVAMSKQSTTDFLDEVSSKLYPFRAELGLKSSNRNPEDVFDMDENFDSAFAPSDMRCLALVSHNEMKAAMKNFVILHKNILKKFRLTGTNSTMTMLKEVFNSDNSVVFGPSCQSGPLGGDAELVALMCSGGLGGMLFFQDPMSAHPHQSDIDCLCRQALVHNVMSCNTPTTAYMVVNTLRTALQGEGRPELIPSFFFTLQSPSVVTYKLAQKKVIASHSAEETRASLMNRLTCSSDSGTEDNKIDVSFKTATTATTVPTTPNSFSTPRSTRRKKESVQHSLMDGLSQSSPCFSNITGVSYGSENSSISDLKIKKRQIERSFEMKYSVSPKTVVEGIQSERGFRHDER